MSFCFITLVLDVFTFGIYGALQNHKKLLGVRESPRTGIILNNKVINGESINGNSCDRHIRAIEVKVSVR